MQNPQKQGYDEHQMAQMGPQNLNFKNTHKPKKKLRPIKIKNPKNMKSQNTREILNLWP